MRKIGEIQTLELTNRFVDVLKAEAISSQFDQEGETCSIWIHNDDHLEKARERLQQFTENPDDPRFQAATKLANEFRKQEEKNRQQAIDNQVSMNKRWQAPSSRETPITTGLILFSILISLFLNFGQGHKRELTVKTVFISAYDFPHTFNGKTVSREKLIELRFKKGLPEIREKGHIWKLITPIFIHLGMMHLIFNMLWTYQLGRLIEQRKGTFRLLILVLLAALISNYMQFLWSGPSFGGMSGVVYALFGFVWMRGKLDPQSGFSLDPTTVLLMIGWLFACYFGLIGNVANTAHFMGILVGMSAGAYRPLLFKRR